MKKINILVVALGLAFSAQSQKIDKLIKEKEVRRIETILSADDMQGAELSPPASKKLLHLLRMSLRLRVFKQ